MLTKKILKEYFATGPEIQGWGDLKFKSRTYKDEVMCLIVNILMDLNGISEKSFSLIDDAVERLTSWADANSSEFDAVIKKFESTGHRKEFCAEFCYAKFFKGNDIIEADGVSLMEKKKSEFEKLKDNKVPLTDEERKQCMDADAVWHHGEGGDPSPAVWKSKNKDGKITFVTNTHRAYNTAKTLKGAIGRYHNFIKDTA